MSSSASESVSPSSTESDDELLQAMEEDDIVMLIELLTVIAGTQELFNPNELRNQGSVDHTIGARDTLGAMLKTPWFFKTLTNFEVHEWQELCSLVVPTIESNARSTGLPHLVSGRPMKLTPAQRLMNFVLYMKHDNTIQWDAFTWNWATTSVCDDSFFIASCVVEAISNEIRWPDAAERETLATQVPQFEGCIGFIDGTLLKIRRPTISEHRVFFNGRKKMYSLNNTVIVDHNGLFIHMDLGFPGSFHDVNILRNSEFHKNWRDFFTVRDDYFEYLLGDPGYVGEEQYIMRRIGRLEIRENADLSAVTAYNKMHSGFRIQVEWGIGGLKQKWRRLMKRYDCTRDKYIKLVYATALLTNFLQRRRQVVGYEVVGDRHGVADNYGWDGDF